MGTGGTAPRVPAPGRPRPAPRLPAVLPGFACAGFRAGPGCRPDSDSASGASGKEDKGTRARAGAGRHGADAGQTRAEAPGSRDGPKARERPWRGFTCAVVAAPGRVAGGDSGLRPAACPRLTCWPGEGAAPRGVQSPHRGLPAAPALPTSRARPCSRSR
ncbi:translation initiation factor IF-2-like [Choloepus didactylus]|uniref:translation initiation factor IF-2-like n=1 Tax=Choloepus didactylus TaxID=27675 RepID=UPI00189D607F|nr:translation initiation factor IF-2-like [Choloepus didactylus]